ncbi:MAG: FtsX-like permease family protein [Ruminococcus sp.]|nr:FtsX-like permease family protein [Ruminococcus sp.]
MKSIAVKNIKGRPARSVILVVISMLLTFAIFGGTMVISSLDSGLSALENRLGADIMVVPFEATTQKKFDDIVLQNAPGYFYMDNARVQQVLEREGIAQASEQFFLASASASCCSVAVQIIGYDPETDFTITPWIKKSYSDSLGELDVVVGNDLNAFVGDTISFYGVDCKVAAKLDKTGTGFDTAVFTTKDTIKRLIQSSVDLGMNIFGKVDPENTVSCIMINAAAGFTPEEVVNDINLHVKNVKAIQSKELISGVSDSLGGVSGIIRVLICAVWILGVVILLLAFTMSVNERRKEFAVLRVAGAARSRLAGIVLGEALMICIIGSILGVLLGFAVILPFNGVIEQALGLPFLLPGAGRCAGYALASLLLCTLSGTLAAAVSALRISRIDTGVILRGDN